jgi:hypothetical protein
MRFNGRSSDNDTHDQMDSTQEDPNNIIITPDFVHFDL